VDSYCDTSKLRPAIRAKADCRSRILLVVLGASLHIFVMTRYPSG